MGQSTMLVLLVVWGFIALSLAQEFGESDMAEAQKPGECPKEIAQHHNNPTLPPCPDLCVNKDNCTIQSCITDTQCPGSLKCCNTRCGMECSPPHFRNPCRGNVDCPWTLKCCSGICDSDCVYQPTKQSFLTKGLLFPVSIKKLL
ncbi:hypothetical protein FKM82_022898 [Ascaphus truei]